MRICILDNPQFKGCEIDGKCHSNCRFFSKTGDSNQLIQCDYPIRMLCGYKSPAFYNTSTVGKNVQGWFMYDNWGGKLDDGKTNGIYFISEYTCMSNKRKVTFL